MIYTQKKSDFNENISTCIDNNLPITWTKEDYNKIIELYFIKKEYIKYCKMNKLYLTKEEYTKYYDANITKGSPTSLKDELASVRLC